MSSDIFARGLTVIQKNGITIKYTHVTKCCVVEDGQLGPVLLVIGETNDVTGDRIRSYDSFRVRDLNFTIIEWYIPVE